jgi:hypothetical protein
MSDEPGEHVFVDAAALVGQLTSLTILAKLVDRGIISAEDAASLLDDALLQLEEWQNLLPQLQQGFEFARVLLSDSLDIYRAMSKTQPDSSP